MDKIKKDSLFRFSDLIDSLYQAPIDPNGFQPFLELLVAQFELADAVFHIQNIGSGAVESAWIAGPKKHAIIEFIEENLEQGNYIQDYLEKVPVSCFYTLLGDVGRPHEDELNESQKQVESWFDRNGMYDASSAIIGRLENQISMLSIHRSIAKSAFTKEDTLILNQLIPHIQRAFSLYQQFKSIRNETSNLDTLIAQLPHGALLYDSKGELICVNQKARGLGQIHDDFSINKNGFVIFNGDTKREYINNLYSVLNRVCKEKEASRVMHIGNGHYPITLLFVSIGLGRQGLFQTFKSQEALHQYEIGAIVYLYDRQHPIHVNSNFLQSIFGLTDSETSICELIVSGYSRDEIAEVLSRSAHTIKDHIKSIFIKTGSHSQSDLIATLLTCPAYPSEQ